MYTQCSECGTIFKLSAETLRAAGGQVRCGKCGEIFNALANLAEDRSAFDAGESPLALERRADSILESPPPSPPPPPPEPEPVSGVDVARLEIEDIEIADFSFGRDEAEAEDPTPEEPNEAGETSMEFSLPPGELDRIFVEARHTPLPFTPPAPALERPTRPGSTSPPSPTLPPRPTSPATPGATLPGAGSPPAPGTMLPPGPTLSPPRPMSPPASGSTSPPALGATLPPTPPGPTLPPSPPTPASTSPASTSPTSTSPTSTSPASTSPASTSAGAASPPTPPSLTLPPRPASLPAPGSTSPHTPGASLLPGSTLPHTLGSLPPGSTSPPAPGPMLPPSPTLPEDLSPSPAPDSSLPPHPESLARVVGIDLSAAARAQILEGAEPPAIDSLVRSSRRVSTRVWWSAAMALGLLLVMQVVHHHREFLAAHGPLAPLLRAAYASAGAPVSAAANLSMYELRQWGVTGDPGADGTLRVRASIMNTAPQFEPYPLLRVTLANRFGTRIGTRDFDAAEYIGKPVAALLKPGERVDATMSIRDPGKDAEGFEIDVCLRATDKKITCAGDMSAAQTKR